MKMKLMQRKYEPERWIREQKQKSLVAWSLDYRCLQLFIWLKIWTHSNVSHGTHRYRQRMLVKIVKASINWGAVHCNLFSYSSNNRKINLIWMNERIKERDVQYSGVLIMTPPPMNNHAHVRNLSAYWVIDIVLGYSQFDELHEWNATWAKSKSHSVKLNRSHCFFFFFWNS